MDIHAARAAKEGRPVFYLYSVAELLDCQGFSYAIKAFFAIK